ncbi:MAG: DUF4383 domain-containing protein [Candidatus Pacebacteria bacterium]|nr:DUF4383 domain-containing protein [Candidatus Paceibacterota bacterium]
MSPIRILGFIYAAGFFFVAIMGYIPPFVDENGLLFGLFALDTYDNSLHGLSGVWALIAASISTRQTILFLKLFGTVYFLDGAMGLALGNAFLDFGIFTNGIADNSFMTNFFLNVPHIIIGGVAAIGGFFNARIERAFR